MEALFLEQERGVRDSSFTLNQEQQNVEIVLGFVNEVFNAGHLEVLDELVAINFSHELL